MNKMALAGAIEDAMYGVLHGNLPEIVGASGAYVTYKDKPYAWALTMEQIRSTALTSSATGAIVALAQSYLFKGKSQNNGGQKKHRNRKRNR